MNNFHSEYPHGLFKLEEPLKEYFHVSTTVMLDYGFEEIRCVLIQWGDEYIDGIFYIKEKHLDYINEFYKKLQDAQLDALITDFDYIEQDGNRIILKKYLPKP